MLDTALVEQLKVVFAPLDRDLILSVRPSPHPKQVELLELLEELSSAVPRIKILVEGEKSTVPRFEIAAARRAVSFIGTPGGQEFSTLVLALLNAADLGRMPDGALRRRTANLPSGIRLQTFVSLSCTNCPDVAQALNQLALMHPDCTHTVVDGALVPDEITRLGIQGVPAVFAGDVLIHSGRADFGTLLEKLESHFGTLRVNPGEIKVYDVVILGGGPAGAAAAVYSARKGLRTAVVAKRVGGQVNDTMGIENLVSVLRTEGPRLVGDLRANMETAGVHIFENRSVESIQNGPVKVLEAAGGERFSAPALIVATGAKWRELGVPGEREHIGRGVAYCPHCDGPFFAGKRVAVIGGGNSGIEASIDLANICREVMVFEVLENLKADAVLVRVLRKLPNVVVRTSARVEEIVGDGRAVRALRWEDRATGKRTEEGVDGVFVQIGLVPNSAPVAGLVSTTRTGEIEVDAHCRTSTAGIYAAGDVTTVPYKQIVIAMGEGSKAALTAFGDRIWSA